MNVLVESIRDCLAASLALAAIGADEPPPSSTVGMPTRVEGLVLPGPELEAIPREDRDDPIVLRIVDVYPHGTARRYDLEFYALEPGDYDLRDSLRRKDGTSTAELPPIPVVVEPVLPPGQIEPNALIPRETPRPGGYRTLVVLGAVLWVLGFAAIVLAGHRRRRAAAAVVVPPRTLAERLRPLVEDAIAGRLDPPGRAELERLLLGVWRRRLGLEDMDPARAAAILREHPEAGPVVRRLEDWLHRPPGTAAEPVDLPGLLAPYRDLPADALERPSTAPAGQGG